MSLLHDIGYFHYADQSDLLDAGAFFRGIDGACSSSNGAVEVLVSDNHSRWRIPLRPGKGWLALRKGENGWELAVTTVSAKRIPSEITEFDVEISGEHKDAIVFVRLSKTKPGPVVTPNMPDVTKLSFGKKENGKYPSLDFVLGARSYRVRVQEEMTVLDHGGGEVTHMKHGALVVEGAGKSSRLGSVGDGPGEEVVIVKWLGDVDRDGKLDLITDNQGSNSGGLCLHLSSSASGKELFGKRICHIGSGC